MNIVVRHALVQIPANLARVPLGASRHTLAKNRWRGVAANGRSFTFELEEPLVHGAIFHADETAFYVLLQDPEKILEIPLGSPTATARLAWMIGHHHFPVQIKGSTLRLADQPAARRLFALEHVCFRERKSVFQPFRPGYPH